MDGWPFQGGGQPTIGVIMTRNKALLALAWGLSVVLLARPVATKMRIELQPISRSARNNAAPGVGLQVRSWLSTQTAMSIGRLATLERQENGDKWVATHHLRMSEDAVGAASVPYGGDLAVLGDAHSDDREWHIRVPEEIEWGEYRVSLPVRIGSAADPFRTTAVSEVLAITK